LARQTNRVDYDNDGDLDVYATDRTGPNQMYRNGGPAGFIDVIDAHSALNRGDHTAQFVDVDGDGGRDLSITDGCGPAGGAYLFHNTLPDTAKRCSLAVQVVDAKGHATRFGAEVRLFDQSGAIIASRQVLTAGGYNTQRVAPLHIGLKNLSPVTVEVTFMGRNGRSTERLTNVRPADYYRKTLVVREAGRPGR
jgi:hypothetical protein